MRYSVKRKSELLEFAKTLPVTQPNRGRHTCAGCGMVFLSEAGFAFHRRTAGPRIGAQCMTPRMLRARGFTGGSDNRGWHCPGWVEFWYLDQLEKESRKALSGFLPEAWK